VELPPRPQFSGAAERSAQAARKTSALSFIGNRIHNLASTATGEAAFARKYPSGKQPRTGLQKEVMEAVRVGVSPFQAGPDRVEKKVASITGTLDDLYARVDRRRQTDEMAAQSMAQFETDIIKGIENAMRSFTTFSESPAAHLEETKSNGTSEMYVKTKLDVAWSNEKDTEAVCEVDDVEWVRCFTMHGAPRPAQARLTSRRPPRPQSLPRHPQWPGPQGPHGTSQGSTRTSGGRPQPHTQDTALHTNLPRSSTPNGSPPKDLQTSTCSVTRQIQRLTTYARASCPWGTAEVHFTPCALPLRMR